MEPTIPAERRFINAQSTPQLGRSMTSKALDLEIVVFQLEVLINCVRRHGPPGLMATIEIENATATEALHGRADLRSRSSMLSCRTHDVHSAGMSLASYVQIIACTLCHRIPRHHRQGHDCSSSAATGVPRWQDALRILLEGYSNYSALARAPIPQWSL